MCLLLGMTEQNPHHFSEGWKELQHKTHQYKKEIISTFTILLILAGCSNALLIQNPEIFIGIPGSNGYAIIWQERTLYKVQNGSCQQTQFNGTPVAIYDRVYEPVFNWRPKGVAPPHVRYPFYPCIPQP